MSTSPATLLRLPDVAASRVSLPHSHTGPGTHTETLALARDMGDHTHGLDLTSLQPVVTVPVTLTHPPHLHHAALTDAVRALRLLRDQDIRIKMFDVIVIHGQAHMPTHAGWLNVTDLLPASLHTLLTVPADQQAEDSAPAIYPHHPPAARQPAV